MRFQSVCVLAISAFAGLCPLLAEDFEASPNLAVENNSDEGTKVEVVPDPAKPDNKVYKLSWGAHSGTHAAAHLVENSPLIEDGSGIYEITARMNFEDVGSECSHVALRVADKGNETFQLSAPIEAVGAPGWTTVKWTFNTDDPTAGSIPSWGEDVNGVVDFPVRFVGFAVGFKDSSTAGGSFMADDVTATKTNP